MEAAIRFSQNSSPGDENQQFLKADVAGKAFQLCRLTHSSKNASRYEVVHASTKVPAFRAFDWHPIKESLIAVGQSGGEATLLNIAEGQHDSTSFSVRSQRLCNAISLNSQNWIGVGLDKVRTDYCLNVWDFNQRLPVAGQRGFLKGYADPIHKLAGGEPITSLKFFQDQPKLLLAGVKGQFVRMYDLRESNASTPLQFATRCVHNLAIDLLDENFFASCYPTNDPSICLWDRRMMSRSSLAQIGFSPGVHQANPQPEVSMELKYVIDTPAQVWSLRFSKSQRGCLGVLSSTGQLKVFIMGTDFDTETYRANGEPVMVRDWEKEQPQGIFLDDVQDVAQPFFKHPKMDEKQRIVSFDFMTSLSKSGQPKLITLTGDGTIGIKHLHPPPKPFTMSSTSVFCSSAGVLSAEQPNSNIAYTVQQIRHEAEPRNKLKQAFKLSKHGKSIANDSSQSHRKLSSFENHAWNADLGYSESGVPLKSLLTLHSQPRRRCEEGYLFNATKNQNIVADNDWLQTFWSWLEHARRISQGNTLVRDGIDFSFLGVYGIWMEDFNLSSRRANNGSNIASDPVSTTIKSLVKHLNIPRGKGCATEYPHNRALCLHLSGLAWVYDDLEAMVDKLVAANEHTKAAALAVFAGEEKMAQQALRAKGAVQRHKMLAMALASARRRSQSGSRDDSDETDWRETVTSLSTDLTDPYARAILAYVRSSNWDDVINETSLPLKYRVNVALRHFDDSKLTRFVESLKHEVIEKGDIEGIVLTGLGTKEGIDLLASYASTFGDLQTAVLGMNYAGLSDRFLSAEGAHYRKVECFRDAYRSQMLSWGLKFDKARFDVAHSRVLAEPGHNTSLPIRKKEQVRLVCTHCTQPLSQFGHDQQAEENGMSVKETKLHPLAPEKAAVAGTVCPKCGRHLPRCGVCDMWLGTPDESFSKWYTKSAPQRPNGSLDLSASMVGSTITAIGPVASNLTANGKDGSKLADLSSKEARKSSEVAVEEIDGDVLKQEQERRWIEAMHRFTVFCLKCSHGFHAEHARLWFEDSPDREGHRVCPVPSCSCICNP